jgi:uncharacterized protein (UPF0333 family)
MRNIMMFKRLYKNKKGTAEVIGSVLFIVILLFFFTNVYLWHDAATKEMNDLQYQKINSPISITYDSADQIIYVTDNGGQDATISGVWVVVQYTPGTPDSYHNFFNLLSSKVVIPAGAQATPIHLADLPYTPSGKGIFKVLTTTGNIASCPFTS